MVKLADTQDLGSCAVRHKSSSLFTRTSKLSLNVFTFGLFSFSVSPDAKKKHLEHDQFPSASCSFRGLIRSSVFGNLRAERSNHPLENIAEFIDRQNEDRDEPDQVDQLAFGKVNPGTNGKQNKSR